MTPNTISEALAAFRASHDVVKSPNTRLMIARSLRELGRLGEAYSEAAATVAEAEAISDRHPRYAETARAARADLDALAPRVGFVKIDLANAAGDGLAAKIGERSLDVATLSDPIAVTPGKATIVVTAAGPEGVSARDRGGSRQHANGESRLRAAAFDGQRRSSEPKPPEPPPKSAETAIHVGPDSSMRTWAYVAGGAGARRARDIWRVRLVEQLELFEPRG